MDTKLSIGAKVARIQSSPRRVMRCQEGDGRVGLLQLPKSEELSFEATTK